MNLPSDDKLATLHNLISTGRTIEAIKLYREATGVGLREAKDAVEAMGESMRSGAPVSIPATLEQASAHHRSPVEEPGSLEAMIFAGQKIQAIKLYRASSGVGLKEAKEAVEAMNAELRRNHPDKFKRAGGSGCSVSATAACLCILGSLYWLLGG